MQRRHNQTKRPKVTLGNANTGTSGFIFDGMRIPASGNFARLGWGYHPTKGFRRVRAV